MNILKHFKHEGNIKASKVINHEIMDKEGAWAYFDGVAQGDPSIGGAGGIPFFTHGH